MNESLQKKITAKPGLRGLLAVGIGIGLLTIFLALGASPGQSALTTGEQPVRPALTPLAAHISQPLAMDESNATGLPEGNAWQTFTVRPGDTLSTLFAQAGLAPAEYLRVMALGESVDTLRLLHPGEKIRLRTDGTQELVELHYSIDPLQALDITTGPEGLQAQLEQLQPITEKITVSDVVDTTLNHALTNAGLSAPQVSEFVDIFHWRVDFRREIRRGTRFSLVYNRRWVGNRELSPGPIVAAELVLHDRTLRAFRFTDANGESGYYDDHGASMHPTLLRTPVHYSRISSPFSQHRFDPVLQIWRPHFGVDLAADSGTPVKASGDGHITFLGENGGYGNLVEVRHFGAYSTRYAHLRRFASNLHEGSFVRQGQVIGYVGQSGEATGPHLHFEIRVNGIPRDPLKVKLPAGQPLNRKEQQRFMNDIRPLLALLQNNSLGHSQLARADEATPPALRAL